MYSIHSRKTKARLMFEKEKHILGRHRYWRTRGSLFIRQLSGAADEKTSERSGLSKERGI